MFGFLLALAACTSPEVATPEAFTDTYASAVCDMQARCGGDDYPECEADILAAVADRWTADSCAFDSSAAAACLDAIEAEDACDGLWAESCMDLCGG